MDNYDKILKFFNINKNISHDSLNTIFYCIEYKKSGTIILEEEYKLFERLIQFDIPIIFIVTKTPYDPDKNSNDEEIEEDRKLERETI